MRSGRRKAITRLAALRQGFQSDSGSYFGSAVRVGAGGSAAAAKIESGWRIWSLPGNGEFFGTAVPHDAPNHPEYDGGRRLPVAQFVPESAASRLC